MTSIWIPVDDISDAYAILDDLKTAGYIMNQDFTWAYHPTKWDNFNGTTSPRGVEFTFMNSTLATWFGLKYGSNS